MVRSLLLLLALCVFQGSSLAQSAADDVTIHLVEPGQTLYFIAKKYDMDIDQLRALNPEIGDDLIIRPGQALMVQSMPETPEVPTAIPDGEYHIVRTKETLYSLSRIYDVSVDDLIEWNDLDNPNIRIGDSLLVRPVNEEALFTTGDEVTDAVTDAFVADVTPRPDPPVTPPGTAAIEPIDTLARASAETDTPIDSMAATPADDAFERADPSDEDPDLFKEFFEMDRSKGADLVQEKGISNYLASPTGTPSYLALVDGVDEGRIIRVRNLMNNKVVYVKVVGRLPASDAQRNISLKISETAARDLNVLEERFLAEWSYYDGI